MRSIHYEEIVTAVSKLCIEANLNLDSEVLEKFKEALDKESSPVAQDILKILIENAHIACKEKIPMCQDTGITVVFLEVGQDVHIEGGELYKAIEEGVRKGYKEGYLRKSVCHPLTRVNTKDNTPPIIHTKIVSGDKLKITVAPKGGGSENMSALKMLIPAQGKEGIAEFVIDTVKNSGPNPCPPLIIGVGIGGNFEKCALLAKKALLRPLQEENRDPFLREFEKELLEKINNLGIGPQGFGGNTTALKVHIEMVPCHIASLPVAVNINCHASRHATVIL